MRKVLILLSLLPMALMAQTISVGDAKNKALQFVQKKPHTRALRDEVRLSLAHTSHADDETYYYVFNNAAGGYVIVGGDEAAQEVLGYSETGTFDFDHIPANVRWWLSQYDAQISQAIREVKAGANKVARKKASAERAEIPAMLTTKWGQDMPYNEQIPTVTAGLQYLPAGCNTTAVAQIMNYHKWPETGVGSKTLDQTYCGLTFSADFENTKYDWEAMSDEYCLYEGTREDIAVGTLMYHVGVAVNSVYSEYGTEGETYNVAEGLINHFRYSKGLCPDFRFYYTDDEWESMIYDELSAGRPLHYGGQTGSDGGHAFVCDGYKDGLFHINWGWDGRYNDYFLLTPTSTEKALTPNGTGTGGGAAGCSYVDNQCVIKGICPDADGSSQYKKLLYCYFPTLGKAGYIPGNPVKLEIKCYNSGLKSEAYEIRFKMVNVNDAEDTYLLDDTYSLTLDHKEQKTLEASFSVPEGVKMGSAYQIVLMYKDEKGEWQQPAKQATDNYPLLQIIDEFEITERIKAGNAANACKGMFNVSFKIKNYTDRTLTKTMAVRVYLALEDGADPVDYFDLGDITLAPGEERKIHGSYDNLRFKDRFIIGEYYLLQVENSTDGKCIGETALAVYYDNKPLTVTVPQMGWVTLVTLNDAEIPEGLNVYSVYYSSEGDTIWLEKQDCLVNNRTYLINGVPGTYQIYGPDIEIRSAVNGCLCSNPSGDPLDSKDTYVLDERDGVVGFYKVHEPTEIGKYEAFLKANSSKEMFAVSVPSGDAPTSLQHIATHGSPVLSRTYELNGRSANANSKGLVTRDGKVFIIK